MLLLFASVCISLHLEELTGKFKNCRLAGSKMTGCYSHCCQVGSKVKIGGGV